jgi:HEAT repeat protein
MGYPLNVKLYLYFLIASEAKMSTPRKKIFGPLLYWTLTFAALITAYSAFVCLKPRLDEWYEVRSLLSMLDSPLMQERESAASKLMEKDFEIAKPHFLQAARDTRSEVRIFGYRRIIYSRSDTASKIPILLSAASDSAAEVRMEAARGFGWLASELSRVLRTSPVANTLPRELESAGLQALTKLLKDASVEVRVAAIETIVSYRPDSSTVADLAAAADDQESTIRLAASKALLMIGGPNDPTSIRVLLELVAERGVSQHRQAALESLRNSNVEAKDRAMASITELILSEDKTLQLDAIECVRSMGPWALAAQPALLRVAKENDPDFRAIVMMAIVAIEGHNTPEAIATLIEIVSDPSLSIERRGWAIGEVHRLQPATLSKATPALIRQLADPNPAIRITAGEFLSRIVVTTAAEVTSPVGSK